MIEIQVHPSDIRDRVRYFFVDRRTVVRSIGAGALLLFFVIGSMAAAPTVIRRVYRSSSIRAEQQDRAVRQEMLRNQFEQMAILERSLDEQRVRVEKLMVAYGLAGHDLSAHGGTYAVDSEVTGLKRDIEEARRRESQVRRTLMAMRRQIDMLARFESDNRELVRHVPSILPIPHDRFVLTSAFGPRTNPFTRAWDEHRGLDLAAPVGTPVYAGADGVVTFAGRYPMAKNVGWWRFGNVVVINHADRFITIYAHCDSVLVKAGQSVRLGQTIATVGSTGWSTNAHLHYEVRSDVRLPGTYEPVDPRIYILNHTWSREQDLLNRARSLTATNDFEPLPSVFLGRKRRV